MRKKARLLSGTWPVVLLYGAQPLFSASNHDILGKLKLVTCVTC